jgi:hypothetical protein
MKLVFLLAILTFQSFSQSQSFFSFDGGFIISHFQQQIKQKVGDPRGERLVHENEFGFLFSGRYHFNDNLSAGLFLERILEKEKQHYLMVLILTVKQK